MRDGSGVAVPRAGLGAGGPSEQSGGFEIAAGHVSVGWEGRALCLRARGQKVRAETRSSPVMLSGLRFFFFPTLLGGSAEPRAGLL